MIFKKKITLILILIPLFLILIFSSTLFLGKEFFVDLFDRSFLDLNISSGEFQMKSYISSSDMKTYHQFIENLNAEDLSALSLGLDSQSTSFLSKNLPKRVYLHFYSQKDLRFHSKGLPSLKNSLSSSQYSLSTDSAKLSLNFKDEQDFSLDISDPGKILNYATSSGKLYISPQLKDMFPILEKVATIKMEVNGQNLNGEVILK